MQVSVCPSVCLSVCPSANYSFISWQICTVTISMDSSCKGKGFKTIQKQIHAKQKICDKKVFFQLGSMVKPTHQYWRFICPLTTFLFLGRIAQQWYLWNPLTKGKVLRPIKNKSKQENKFWRQNFLCSSESLLPMQVSVCLSVR